MSDATMKDSVSDIQYPPSILEDVTKLVQRVQTFTGATGAAIALLEGEEMICRASRGSNAPDVGVVLSLEGTFAGLAVKGMKALRCDDAENDSRMDPEISRTLRIRSMAVVPVLSGMRVTGVIATFSNLANAFSDTHMAVLKTMADGLGAAVQRWQETMPAPPPEAPKPQAPPPRMEMPKPPAPPPVPKAEIPKTAPKIEIPRPAPKAEPPKPPVVVPPAPPAPRLETPKPAPSVIPAPKIEIPKPVIKPLTTPAAAAPARAPEKKPDLMQQTGKWKVTPVAEDITPETKLPSKKAEPRSESKAEPVPSFGYAAEKAEGGGKGKLIAVAAVVLVVVLGGGYFLFMRKPTTTATSAATNAPKVSTPATAPAEPAASQPTTTTPVTEARNTAPAERSSSRSESPAPQERSGFRVAGPGPSLNTSGGDVAAPSLAMGGSAPNLAANASVPRLASQAPAQSVVIPSRLLQRVNPVYPPAAGATRASGDVTMQATVGTDGRVKGIKVVSGHPLLRDAAVRALQQWKYSPSTVNGHAVDSPVTVTVTFRRPE